jgi:hypothetical protein
MAQRFCCGSDSAQFILQFTQLFFELSFFTLASREIAQLGTLVHMLFLLLGDSEELGGFHTSMDGVLQLVGREIVWDMEPKGEEAETPKVVVN